MAQEMFRRLRAFAGSEAGAVTVDFVVITAAIVALTLTIVIPILGQAMGWGNLIAGGVASVPLGSGN